MSRLRADAAASTLRLWTEKEGLLSKVAHDLCLEPSEFEVRVERAGERLELIEVELPVAALRVQGQVKDGQVVPLSSKDHQEIERNLAGPKVLDAGRYPQLSWRGSGTLEGPRIRAEGELSLHGQRGSLPLTATWEEREGATWVSGEVRFAQTRFGVKPYRALMGALKVKDEVRVSWELRLREEES